MGAYARAVPAVSQPIVTWNPFVSISDAWRRIVESRELIAFDLLDDWTIHYAFQGVQKEVRTAYAKLFDRADIITANAEGTVDLAKRFGRDDVVLLPNGCDPDRFLTESRATGPLTVGYVGKIGRRLNLELILHCANALPRAKFVFAGPILDSEYKAPLESTPNIDLLGDVHYTDVPQLLTHFDVGWVPHRVGSGEVGGDVIKTYEYRAAGLPVLSTPVGGVKERGLDAVYALDPSEHADWLTGAQAKSGRVNRIVTPLPTSVKWSAKADLILNKLGLAGAL
ncbi:glycosyltransferase [Microbacterium sp. SSW1-59]|uniref:glycosyltransferase n=1 Tax=Microbacterium xanthum TaxID=3079794 RepID=UPI002AD4C3B1|nr:glycosyltransferase [Microbacterium sp. SSW1-59]MDZ8201268.1 glycosyltransferase [Microbacterium sp. SSW1-59]